MLYYHGMEPFLIATANLGKFEEIATALESLPYRFLSLRDLGLEGQQVEENGTTHEENARLKTDFFYQKTGYLTLGEDSGLEVEALQGELGLHTRRFGAGEKASDEEWLRVFLERMREMPASKREAKFVCVMVLKKPSEGKEFVFEGEARGHIVLEPEAPILPGLPLSSVFKPDGFDRVYAALTHDEKNQISHRGLAAGKVVEFLKTIHNFKNGLTKGWEEEIGEEGG